MFVLVFLLIAVFGARASSRPAAAFMLFAAFAAYLFDSVIYIPLVIAFAGIAAWRFRGRTEFERPGRRVLREATLCTTVFVLYEIGRHLVEGSWESARSNAESLMAFQDRLHLNQEYTVQQFLFRNDTFVGLINSAYSWFFLPFVAGAVFWLFIAEDNIYRRFRTCLAISAALAIVIMALCPVAPPRMMPGSDIIGTHAMRGGSHSFVNQFAAVPSLHVGWVALSGVALFTAVKHWIRWIWLIVPVFVMSFTVMATGHHYLLDGFIGSMIGVGPFLFLTYRAAVAASPNRRITFAETGFGQALNAAAREIADVPRLRFTTYTMGFLLTYMIVRQVVDHGFTNYWGYMVAQIAISIILILIVSVKFAREGGLSIVSHGIVVVTTYADTLGTAGHMYDRYIAYDKITHFLGTAAVVTAAGDILLAMRRRGTITWGPLRVMVTAIVVAMTAALAWEVYEFYGDRLFGTGRHAGAEDTIYDIVSDAAGAYVAAGLLYLWHFAPHNQAAPSPAGSLVVDTSREDDRRL